MNRIQLHVLEWVGCGVLTVVVVMVSSPSEGRLLFPSLILCDPSPLYSVSNKRYAVVMDSKTASRHVHKGVNRVN